MKKVTVFKAHDSYVLGLLYGANQKTLTSCGMDKMIRTWSTPRGELVRTFEGHANSVNSMALSPDNAILVSGSTDQTVRIWSFHDGELLHVLRDRKKTVAGVAMSTDGQWIAAAFYGGRVIVWTVAGEMVVGIKASKKNVTSVAFSPDGKTLATSGLGDDVQLWSLPDGTHQGSLAGHEVAVWGLTFIQDGNYLVSMGYEGSIRFWDTSNWRTTRILQPEKPGVRGILFSPNEEIVALSLESKVQLQSVEEWKLEEELPVGTKVISSMAFSPDGRWLAIGGADRKIRLWQAG